MGLYVIVWKKKHGPAPFLNPGPSKNFGNKQMLSYLASLTLMQSLNDDELKFQTCHIGSIIYY